MKSLDQIEARTPITALPFTISTGGSYYLTKSLSVSNGNGITIAVDDVTLDLNGFTISSTASPASGDAVLLSGGRRNVRVTNGNIVGSVTFNGSTFTGAGFQHGIVGTTADPIATTVSFVNISGLSGAGIYLGLGGAATLIDACNVYTVGGNGLTAVSITNSTASQCGAAAITGQTVMNCRGDCVANDIGINATNAINCYGASTNNIGVMASNATNCYGANFLGSNSPTTVGLSAATATGCYGASNHGTGVIADTALNCEAATGATGGNILVMSVKNAENCYANGANTGGGSYGIFATGSVKNCYAIGFNGIHSATAEGSTGLATGVGISATVAAYCYGGPATGSTSGNLGVNGAAIAIGCYGQGSPGVTGDVVSYCTGAGGAGSVTGNILFACDGANFSASGTYFYFCGHTGPTTFPDSSTF